MLVVGAGAGAGLAVGATVVGAPVGSGVKRATVSCVLVHAPSHKTSHVPDGGVTLTESLTSDSRVRARQRAFKPSRTQARTSFFRFVRSSPKLHQRNI